MSTLVGGAAATWASDVVDPVGIPPVAVMESTNAVGCPLRLVLGGRLILPFGRGVKLLGILGLVLIPIVGSVRFVSGLGESRAVMTEFFSKVSRKSE